MTPGRELDALVAVHVLGWTRHERHPIPDRPKVDSELTKITESFSRPREGGGRTPVFGLGFPPAPDDRKFPDEGPWFQPPNEGPYHCTKELPEYSEDIAAAWEIVEHWGHGVEVLKAGDHYSVLFTVPRNNGMFEVVTASAKSAPHAICLAALKAVGVEVAG